MKNLKPIKKIRKTLSLQVLEARVKHAIKYNCSGVSLENIRVTNDVKQYIKRHKRLLLVDNKTIRLI